MRLVECDQCGKQSRSQINEYLGPDSGWIAVEANEDSDHGLLCSWACLAGWATARVLERELQL